MERVFVSGGDGRLWRSCCITQAPSEASLTGGLKPPAVFDISSISYQAIRSFWKLLKLLEAFASFWNLEKCEENLHRFGITAQDIANLRQDARIVELLGIFYHLVASSL